MALHCAIRVIALRHPVHSSSAAACGCCACLGPHDSAPVQAYLAADERPSYPGKIFFCCLEVAVVGVAIDETVILRTLSLHHY